MTEYFKRPYNPRLSQKKRFFFSVLCKCSNRTQIELNSQWGFINIGHVAP